MASSKSKCVDGRPMNYRNTEMKLDQIITYLNEGKINLSPAFQRGHVWPVATRRKLIANMVQGRPIPSIFLYKDPQGTRFSYNILDGKQRLESLILFVGDTREDVHIPRWREYFFPARLRQDVSFWVELPNGKRTFQQLDEDTLREFREYSIPTIEINLTDSTTLDEIINLFADINQQGVPVNRFSIVKAMGRDNALLRSVFKLIALQQKRGKDVHYRAVSNEFTHVLKTLTLVSNIQDNNARVDRMWERLLEIVLVLRTGDHRKPVDVLKRFIRIRSSGQEPDERLTNSEIARLRRIFQFLRRAYRQEPSLSRARLATDQTHFYTMITALIAGNLLDQYDERALTRKLVRFARVVDGAAAMPKDKHLASVIADYLEVSSKQTTDVSRRQARQDLFIEAIGAFK
jgi:Protein of unknown function DUF262